MNMGEFQDSIEGRPVTVIYDGEYGDLYISSVFYDDTGEEVEHLSGKDETRFYATAEEMALDGQIDHAEALRDMEREGG